jgi:cell division protein FtsL
VCEEIEIVSGSRDGKATQNIFQIMDELVRQLNRTKKMFLIMIVSIIIVVPGTFITTFALAGGNAFWNWNGQPHTGGPPDVSAFRIAGGIVVAFVLGWIVVGVRQWFILSKWTQRYELYKELQKKIDEKLDDGENGNEESS